MGALWGLAWVGLGGLRGLVGPFAMQAATPELAVASGGGLRKRSQQQAAPTKFGSHCSSRRPQWTAQVVVAAEYIHTRTHINTCMLTQMCTCMHTDIHHRHTMSAYMNTYVSYIRMYLKRMFANTSITHVTVQHNQNTPA